MGQSKCPQRVEAPKWFERTISKDESPGFRKKGLLTHPSAQALHEHRYLGNTAVHELARPSAEELKSAIEIVEHVLEQLYELPEKAEELRRAIARRKK